MGSHHPAEYFAESILNPNRVIVQGAGYTGEDGLSKMPSYAVLETRRLLSPFGAATYVARPRAVSRLARQSAIHGVSRLALGLKHTTATIHYSFHTLRLTDGETILMNAEVIDVELRGQRRISARLTLVDQLA